MAATTPRKRPAAKKASAAPKQNPFDDFRKGFDGHHTITLHKRWRLAARCADLAAIVESVSPAEGAEVARELRDLKAEYDESAIELTLKALTRAEAKQIASMSDDAGYDYLYDQLAVQVVEPSLTADQWRQMEPMLGIAQWETLVYSANELVDNLAVVPDFSPAILAALSMLESSEDSGPPETSESDLPSSMSGTTSTDSQP